MKNDLEHEELVLVEKINALLNSKTSLEGVFKAIIEGMVDVFGYYSSGAYLLSKDKKHLTIKDYYLDLKITGRIQKLLGFNLKGYKIPLFEGSLLKNALDEKQILVVKEKKEVVRVVEHHTLDQRLRKLAGPITMISGIKSGVGIPLLARGEVVGMFGIGRKEGDFGEEDLRRLKAFGVQAGLAIEKAKIYSKLEDYSRNLENMVAEKTRELKAAQKRLIITEKFAALGRLAAGVAHEINNPIGNISLSVELLKKREADPYKIEKLNIIMDQVDIASKIVKNLLVYSRESELRFEMIDLNSVILKTLELSEHNLSISNIRIVKELAPGLPLIIGDSKKLQQVILNIITNSIQAMPKGGALTLRSHIEDESVIIEIDDTGPGIPMELRDKVFDPCFTTKDLSTSAGLGLSVSKGIIEDHNGSIMIVDSERHGTKVVIRLPIDEGL